MIEIQKAVHISCIQVDEIRVYIFFNIYLVSEGMSSFPINNNFLYPSFVL